MQRVSTNNFDVEGLKKKKFLKSILRPIILFIKDYGSREEMKQ